MEHIAYISVGSNLGERLENCRFGVQSLGDGDCSLVTDISPFYMTEPVGFKEQNWFVNAVFKLKTRHEPLDLFREIQEIQRRAGRKEDTIRFGPRILDLDILLFDDLVFDSAELVIPHPRMHERRFVLKPMCDLDDTLVHPVLKKQMRELLDALDKESQKVVPC